MKVDLDGLPILGTILAGALALRLYGLGTVFPLPDEYMQFYSSLHPHGLRDFVALVQDNPHHLLLDPLIAFFVGRFTGSPFWLRLPSAVEGMLAVAGLWALGRRGGRVGLGAAAAILLALCAMHVEWSRRADFYALAAALAVAQTLLLFRALDEKSRWPLYGFGAAVFLLAYPHAPLLAATHGLFIAAIRKRRDGALTAWAACWVGALLLTLPVLKPFAVRMPPGTYGFPEGNWRHWPLLGFLSRLPAYLALDTETIDPPGGWSKVASALFAPAGLGLYLLSLARLRRSQTPGPVHFAHLAVPFGLGCVLTGDAVCRWYLTPRQTLWLQPFYLLAVADGGAHAWDYLRARLVRPRLWGLALAAGLLGLVAAADLQTTAALIEQSRGRDRILTYIVGRLGPRDSLLFEGDLLEHCLLYHLDPLAFQSAKAFRVAPATAFIAGRRVALGLIEKSKDEQARPGAWAFRGTLADFKAYPPAAR